MKVYFQEGDAYVEIGNQLFLRIGTEQEVKNETPLEISKRFLEAHAWAQYRAIHKTFKHTVH
jgi:hypothetical protein